MMRKDDPAFKKVVDTATAQLYKSGADQRDLRQVVPEADSAEGHQPERADERRSSRTRSRIRPTAATRPSTSRTQRRIARARINGGPRLPVFVSAMVATAQFDVAAQARWGRRRRELQLELGHLLARCRADGRAPGSMTLIIGPGLDAGHRAVAWVIALLLGSVIGVMRTTPNKWAVRLGNAYVELFRNIPLLVQMFLWFFVLPELLPKALGDCDQADAAAVGVVRAGGARASASSPRRASPSRCAPASSRCRAARAWPAPRWASRCRRPTATCCCRWRSASSCRRSRPSSMNIIKNSSVALTIGLLELTAAARSMQEFTLPGVRGVHRGDGDLHPHQPHRRAS